MNRALRLRKGSDFQRVRQQGRSITSRLLILAWVPNEATTLRVGFVVSKRISKLAVKPNHIKRLFSEPLRTEVSEDFGHWDILICFSQAIFKAELITLQQQIR